MRTPWLVAALVGCDVLLIAALVPLEHYSIAVAENRATPDSLRIELIIANLALLGVVFLAMTISGVLAKRVIARLARVKVITGTVEQQKLKQRA